MKTRTHITNASIAQALEPMVDSMLGELSPGIAVKKSDIIFWACIVTLVMDMLFAAVVGSYGIE